IADLRVEAAVSGVEIHLGMAFDGAVRCNPGVLNSLVSNLVRNAVKYIGRGPERHVEVRVVDRGDRARFEVEDNGPGLPRDIEQRVFEPYVRAPDTRQRGIGLGLATVKRLAEAHGGSVGFRSIPGAGCTFWFELPKPERVTALAAPRRTLVS